MRTIFHFTLILVCGLFFFTPVFVFAQANPNTGSGTSPTLSNSTGQNTLTLTRLSSATHPDSYRADFKQGSLIFADQSTYQGVYDAAPINKALIDAGFDPTKSDKFIIVGQGNIDKFAENVSQQIHPEDAAAKADLYNRLHGAIRGGNSATTSPAGRDHNPNATIEKVNEPDIYEKVINFFLYIFSYAFFLTTLLLGFLIDLSSKFIDFAYSAMYIASSRTVTEGWRFTRDMLNFIFILVLLAISFSTIAGLETFSMRKTLPRLLFSALLVNFSLVIGAAFLQVSNVMTTTIVESVMPGNDSNVCNGSGKNIGCRLAVGLTRAGSIGELYTFDNVDWGVSFGLKTFQASEDNGASLEAITKEHWDQYLAIVIKSMIATIMIGVFAVAFIFLGILMFVRIIALAILFILAPVPYVFSLIPKAQKYADDWWSKFINYVFFLPIVTFFLALAIRMLQRTGGDKQTTSLIAEFWGKTEGNAGFFTSVTGSLVDVVFISIFIFAAVYVARSLSIFGANGALKAAKGTVLGAGNMVGMWPTRKYLGEKTGVVGAYKGATQAWATRQQLKQERIGQGTGARLGGWAATIGDKQARERNEMRRVQELASTYEKDGLSEEETKNKVNNGTKTERAAAAAYGLKKETFDNEKDFRAALAATPEGSNTHKGIQKAFDKYNPILSRSGGDITEAMLADPTQSADVQEAINKHKDGMQSALNKAGADDVARWSGNLVETILKSDLDLGTGKVDAILSRGKAEAKDAVLKAYTKQTGSPATISTKKGSGGLSPTEEALIQRRTNQF